MRPFVSSVGKVVMVGLMYCLWGKASPVTTYMRNGHSQLPLIMSLVIINLM